METEHTPQLSPVEVEELAAYRPLSWLAVISLICGVLSFLSIFTVAGWLFALVAMITAVAALRAIAQDESSLSGRSVAVWGLCLALGFLTWGVVWLLVEQAFIYGQAHQYSRHWLDLVRQGRLEQAHQLHLPHSSRLPVHASLTEHYTAIPDHEDEDPASPDEEPVLSPKEELENFFSQEPLRQIVQMGERSQVRHDGGELQIRQPQYQIIDQRYTLLYEEDGRQRILPLTIVMQRLHDGATGDYLWNVAEVLRRERP